jgi:hypothetical protein
VRKLLGGPDHPASYKNTKEGQLLASQLQLAKQRVHEAYEAIKLRATLTELQQNRILQKTILQHMFVAGGMLRRKEVSHRGATDGRGCFRRAPTRSASAPMASGIRSRPGALPTAKLTIGSASGRGTPPMSSSPTARRPSHFKSSSWAS